MWISSVLPLLFSIYFLEDNVFKGKIFRNKLKNIEEQSKGVLQFCHRSYLVNGDYVSEILKEGHKQYLVLNTEDKKIPLSKSYIDKFSSIYLLNSYCIIMAMPL